MNWSRRRFAEKSAAIAAVAGIWGCPADGDAGAGGPGGAVAEAENGAATVADPAIPAGQLGPRHRLAEAGPMVPPVPAILLTINGADGDPDEISVLWTFVVNGAPPQIGVSAGSEHLARRLLEQHPEFVLNVPSATFIEAFDTVDMNSSQVGDKFALAGLTRGRAALVDAPTIEEAPIHCECRTISSLEVPPSRKLFVAEVVATTALEGAVDQNGRLVVPAVPFFGMTAGSGEHYTMGQRVGNIGMTVGRSDIKY